jgi:hypothetical protein
LRGQQLGGGDDGLGHLMHDSRSNRKRDIFHDDYFSDTEDHSEQSDYSEDLEDHIEEQINKIDEIGGG